MSTKFKILSSIAFIALAIVLTFVGVWALADLDFTVGGNITYTAPEPESILKHDEENGYYYVEMGTYSGSAVRWRLVGIKEEGETETTRFDATTMSKPTSGTGTFILETLIDANALNNVFDATNFTSDYSNSGIRKYLKGDYLTELNLTNDATYQAIAPRSITDLHTDIGWATSSSSIGAGNQWSPPAGATQYATYDTTPGDATGSDSLWLMSVKEVYTLLGGGTIGTDKVISNTWSQDVKDGCNWDAENTSDYYWLRSPRPINSDGAFYVDYGGGWSTYNVDFTHAVRPAFNLNF